ncbi:MAG TPA: hypothetical protein VFN31_01950 [Candidatus Saccharimonadales bacterium]|nr:hypothetical protein [Candidatus Saccharimonadales bacterium]
MLLTFPTDILIAIFTIILIGVVCFVVFLSIFNAKQSQDVRNEPDRIRKKADAPEMPSEGQADKPIEEMDKIKK